MKKQKELLQMAAEWCHFMKIDPPRHPWSLQSRQSPQSPSQSPPRASQSHPRALPKSLPESSQMPPLRGLLPDASSQLSSPRCLLPDAFSQLPPPDAFPRCLAQMPSPRCLLPDASSQMPRTRCFLLDTSLPDYKKNCLGSALESLFQTRKQ